MMKTKIKPKTKIIVKTKTKLKTKPKTNHYFKKFVPTE